MKLLIIAILVNLLFEQTTSAQNSSRRETRFELDTILSTGIRLSQAFDPTIRVTCNAKSAYAYLPSVEDSDTIRIIKTDLETKQLSTIYGVIPQLSQKIVSPSAMDFDCQESHLALLFFKGLALFQESGSNLNLVFYVSLNEPYDHVSIASDHIVLARTYNVSEREGIADSRLAKFDFGGKEVASLLPPLDYIEFSHFSPRKWFDAVNRIVALAEPSRYTIRLYDSGLNIRDSITRAPDNWISFSADSLVSRLRADSTSAKGIIEVLSPHIHSSSRIEWIEMPSDSLLVVRYVPGRSEKLGRLRYFDIWKRDGEIWRMLLKDVADVRPDANEVISKTNFAPLSTYASPGIDPQARYIVTVRVMSTVNPIGLTYRSYRDAEDDAQSKAEPQYAIVIHRLPTLK